MPEPDASFTGEEGGLYEVVPERFIAARDELRKRLRSQGDKEGASRVGKLRRPPLTVWALNQVARRQPEEIEEMLAAGAELRAAMERALDGDASGLRQAHAQDRGAMDAVVAAAGGRLAAAGYPVTDTLRQRMAATLRAATVDASVASELVAGVLTEDRDAPGFGIDAFSVPLSPSKSKAAPKAGEPTATSRAREEPGDDAESPADTDAEATRRQELLEQAARAAEEARRSSDDALALRRDADDRAAEAQRLEDEARSARQRATEAEDRAVAGRDAARAAQENADRLAAEAADRAPAAPA